MVDNDELSDADLVRLVAAQDERLGQMVQARLRRLRLVRVQAANLPPVDWQAAIFGPAVVKAQANILAALKRFGR